MDIPPPPPTVKPAAPVPNPVPQGVVWPPPKKSPAKALLIAAVLVVVLAAVFFGVKFGLQFYKKSQPIELSYWGLWENESVIQPVIDEYQQIHPKVKISYKFQSPREYRERLQTALAGGNGPDIFRLHNSWIPMFKSDLSSIPPTVYSASEFESTFYPTTKTDLRQAGNYVAIPLEIDGLAMYINDDLLTASGLSVPQTWEDLRTTAKALSVCDSEDGTCSTGDRILVSGVAMGTADNVDHWQDILVTLMLQNNVNLNSPSGQSTEDALSFYTIFNRAEHIWDSTLPPSTQTFAAGKLAIYFAPSWRVFDLQAINPRLKFSVHPVPQLPLDLTRSEKPVTWASYWVESVNKKSPNSAAAWEFLKFLSSKEALAKLYQQAVISGRSFGEPYSRTDLASSLTSDPLVAPYISQAQFARSWYIASNTFDGATGINTRLSAHFADAVNSINQGRSPTEVVKTLNTGINQVLSQYGLATSLAP